MSDGIFITKGMSLSLSNISLSINSEGTTGSSLSIGLRFDACAAWARIAIAHSEAAKLAREARIRAWGEADEFEKGRTIEDEFSHSLQAIVAAASAVDALYAVAKQYAKLPEDQLAPREKRRSSRQRQVAEIFRRAFGISSDVHARIITKLDAIYNIRGAALHPSGRVSPPELHPELNLLTEWRLVTFRAQVADSVVCSAINLIYDLLGSRLIDRHSQNMTVAASATADRKVLAHRS